jgi:SOS response regulatory protein OraA/RecX
VHTRRARFGSRRIREELERRGVDAEGVATAMDRVMPGERVALEAVWRKKFGAAPRTRCLSATRR